MASYSKSESEMFELLKEAKIRYQNNSKVILENKEYLTKMYNDLSSSYETLNRETNENLVMIDCYLLSSFRTHLRPATSWIPLKACFGSPGHKFLEEKMKAKRKQLTQVQKVMKLFLTGNCEEIGQVRSILQGISLPLVIKECSKATETGELSSPIDNAQGEVILQQKFKPKFGPLQVKNESIQYSAVVITQVVHPYHIYVRFEDQYLSVYHHMMEDLQLEFGEATNESPSYCPTPVEGEAYALQLGKIWYRVMLEKHLLPTPLVFHVDSGHCESLKPNMVLHIIPERFMNLNAQAVRCALYGLIRPQGPGPSNWKETYSKSRVKMLRNYIGTRAFAIIKNMKSGKVGTIKQAGVRELNAFVVLYANGATQSINKEIGQSDPALLFRDDLEIDLPEDQELRRKALIAAEPWVVPETTEQEIKEEEAELKTCLEDSGLVLLDESAGAISTSTVSNNNVEQEMENSTGAVTTSAKPSERVEEELILTSVSLVGAQSPKALLFRTPELTAEFVKMQNTLYKHFEETLDDEESISGSIDVGLVCAANFQGRWYRAEVVGIKEHPDVRDVVVSLVDKGLSTTVHASQIRRLPEELECIPMTVLHCSLSGVYPSSASSGWDPKVTKYIKDRLERAQQISIGFRKNPTDDSAGPDVTVYIEESDHQLTTGFSLNKELVSLGLASFRMSTWKLSTLPELEETFWAKATWVKQKGEIFFQDLSSKMELESIRQFLNDKYKKSIPSESDLCCSPGDLCIAKYRGDWYRGIITQVNGKEVTVHFSDYGTCNMVDINDIRLDLALEGQVLHCSLYNLNQLECDSAQEWKADHVKDMREAVVEREFRVVVKAL